MDYTEFLQKEDEVLRLPCFEGKSVSDDKRSYRLRETLVPGWYSFKLRGRFLIPEGPVEPETDSWDLKGIRGYVVRGQFVGDDIQKRLFHLPCDEELPRFAPVTVREWFDGHLIFDGQEFESEAEAQVREAYEEEREITGIKGVTPALANAFVIESTRRALAREAERRAREAEDRQREAERLARWQVTLEGRIALALSHTGAELLDWRNAGRNEAVVRYRFGSRRFECTINTDTLQIVDAGICLEGADPELNLSSLPSAVREAIDTGRLHVYRHG